MIDVSTLSKLGWKDDFQKQLSDDELEQNIPCRVITANHNKITVSDGQTSYTISLTTQTLKQHEQITVGDWVLLSKENNELVRLLDRLSLMQRQAPGADQSKQLMAANLDTLFIVTSCNDDFNLSRLERYLALAHSANTSPVFILTKIDLCDDVQSYIDQAKTLNANIAVEAINTHEPEAVNRLHHWCKKGDTIALIGSSGVGKSTLVNALGAETQQTGEIREDDSKGRHTTTHRSLLPLGNGAILLDSPGIRGLELSDAGSSVAAVFDDIVELASQCRFNDCKHGKEPGCAINAALASSELSQRRLDNYTKILEEQEIVTKLAKRKKTDKVTSKTHKNLKSHKKHKKVR